MKFRRFLLMASRLLHLLTHGILFSLKAMLQRLIEVVTKLGTKVIRVPFFGNAEIRQEDLTSERFVDGWKMVADTAEKWDVQLGIESTIDATAHQFIIDRVGSKSIGVYV